MRLAQTANPAELLRLLKQIEATRAPLHPLALQAWLTLFGPSDLAGRSFAALCGVLIIVFVYLIGRGLFDSSAALWAAWLAAVSPLLVQYSQEVKMYSCLLMITCISWWMFFRCREAPGVGRCAGFAISQAALVFSHPLGGFMVVAQAIAFFATMRSFAWTFRRWFLTELAAGILVLPWLPNYFDHAPESLAGPQGIKMLLGLPIGFVGGNSVVLLVCGLIIAIACVVRENRDRWRIDRPASLLPLWIWFTVPPVLLFVDSKLRYPLFGPARYTLFVGPAYLLLLGRGLAKLPIIVATIVAAIGLALALVLMSRIVYAPDLKADWRAAAAIVGSRPGTNLYVASADPRRNVEVETARYYLGPNVSVLPAEQLNAADLRADEFDFFAVGTKNGVAVAAPPAGLRVADRWSVPGLSIELVSPAAKSE